MRTQAKNQVHALAQWPVVVPEVQQQLEAVIATLDAQIRTLDVAIADVLATGAWAASAVRLQSIPGVGLLTAAWILVATVHVPTCPTAETAVGYAGLNPLERRSGTSIRGRPAIGHGGHARLRTALYMAVLSTAQHNPAIKPFYQRLRRRASRRKWRAVPQRGSCCAWRGPS